MRLAPGSPPLQRARPAVPGAAFVVGSLIAVLAVSWFAVVTQPSTLATTAWWPAAGIALGLGIRFPRKDVWMVALAVGVLSLPVALYAGRPGPLAVAVATGRCPVAGAGGRCAVCPAPLDVGARADCWAAASAVAWIGPGQRISHCCEIANPPLALS